MPKLNVYLWIMASNEDIQKIVREAIAEVDKKNELFQKELLEKLHIRDTESQADSEEGRQITGEQQDGAINSIANGQDINITRNSHFNQLRRRQTSINHPPGIEGALGASPADIQAEYQVIADSVQRIQLPPETVLKNSRQGIPRELQVAHNIITKCAKYAETTIKLLATLSEGRVTTSDLEKLFTVQYAEVKFLQDELAALIVQGQFDPGTSKLFKALQRNSSVFTPEALDNLRSAATISAAATPPQQAYRGRQRGRGGFHRGNRNSSDYFQNATHRSYGGNRRFNNHHQSFGPNDNNDAG